jgi:hypothetical protein
VQHRRTAKSRGAYWIEIAQVFQEIKLLQGAWYVRELLVDIRCGTTGDDAHMGFREVVQNLIDFGVYQHGDRADGYDHGAG